MSTMAILNGAGDRVIDADGPVVELASSAHIPGTMKLSLESLAGVSAPSRRKLLAGNAERLFRIPSA